MESMTHIAGNVSLRLEVGEEVYGQNGILCERTAPRFSKNSEKEPACNAFFACPTVVEVTRTYDITADVNRTKYGGVGVALLSARRMRTRGSEPEAEEGRRRMEHDGSLEDLVYDIQEARAGRAPFRHA